MSEGGEARNEWSPQGEDHEAAEALTQAARGNYDCDHPGIRYCGGCVVKVRGDDMLDDLRTAGWSLSRGPSPVSGTEGLRVQASGETPQPQDDVIVRWECPVCGWSIADESGVEGQPCEAWMQDDEDGEHGECRPVRYVRESALAPERDTEKLVEERDYLLERQAFAVWGYWEKHGDTDDVARVAAALLLRPSTAKKAIALAHELRLAGGSSTTEE